MVRHAEQKTNRTSWIFQTFLLAFSVNLSVTLLPARVKGAETIRAAIGPVERTLSVKSLEIFAKESKIAKDFRPIARRLNPEALEQFRSLLQQPIDMNAVSVSQVTYTPMGEEFLKRLGRLIRTETGQNGLYAIRAAAILAADAPEDMTLLSIMRYFPTKSIRIDVDATLALARQISLFTDYRDAALNAISIEAERAIAVERSIDFSQRPNLQQLGSYQVQKRELILTDSSRTDPRGGKREFPVDIYLPQSSSQPAPVVVFSHGLSLNRAYFNVLAKHLASHGFVSVVPEHIGSNAAISKAFLEGFYYGKTEQFPFINRPLDITFTLDELERLSRQDPRLTNRMNLERVGIIGHSFGGYTALALASGKINHPRLSKTCAREKPTLNLSLILQCRALELPAASKNINLQDSRIVAAIAINPVSSAVLGLESLRQIKIPVMMVQGSHDFVTPMVQEQLHPFIWLTTAEKYLVTMNPGGHDSANQTQINQSALYNSALQGANTDLGSKYTRALSLAFMQVHLNQMPEYKPYLSATYANYMSKKPLAVNLVYSLTAKELENSFKRTPPLPIIPKSIDTYKLK